MVRSRPLPLLLAFLTLAALLGSPSASRADVPGPRRAGREVRPQSPMRSPLPAGALDRLHRRAASTGLGDSSAPASRSTANVLTGFAGVADGSPYTTPADPTGAAGPDFFLAAVNVHAEVLDRSGVLQAGPFRLNQLFGNLPNGTDSDPKVIYDSYNHHFVLVYLVYNNSQDYIVVVTIPEITADQKSTWCHWTYNGDQIAGDGHQFADYPAVGLTQDRVTITTNNFPFTGSGYDYAQILSFKKPALYQRDCSPAPKPIVFGGAATRDPDGSKAFSIQPAQTVGGSAPSAQFMASFDPNSPSTSAVVLWRLRFVNGNPQLSKTAMRVLHVGYPPYGNQCGGTGTTETLWDTADLRLTSAFYDADRGLFYTANAMNHQFGSGPTESAVRWYEVNPGYVLSNSTITRNGDIGREGYDSAWPSVATNSDGALFVNYSEASTVNDECLSFDTATVEPGQTLSTGPIVVKAGEGRYEASSGRERWGDFSAINRDPADLTGSTMAAFNAYAYNPLMQSETYMWAEWVALLNDV